VEELTLHLIELNRKTEQKQSENEALKEEVRRMKNCSQN